MPLTLEQLNSASHADAALMLDGLYEHSPWIAEQALAQRPFTSLAHLKHAMCEVLAHAGRDAQLGLIRAHPELAGKAMVSKTLTAESTNEQTKAGLTDCTPDEFAKIQKLNADYNAKFGWPFILAVRGPRGVGYNKQQIIDAFERRLHGHPEFELAECLRNIHRIVEIRLNDKFGVEPTLGHQVWDWQEKLAKHSDPGFAEAGQLTVTYLTDAHRACAQRITHNMRDCGFDEVYTDAVGNVVGRYHPATAGDKYLLTGSHYDTVRNGGKYDGRLGIFVPMACVQQLHQQGQRLPFGIEVVAFAEEEGQRYKATFLGSGALIGDFKPEWLDQQDADGITMRAAMQHAGLCVDDIPKIQRDPAQYLGFVEVHIEQGPVLNEVNIPLGVVSSINGSVRYLCEVMGTASHAGTTPMDRRRDAACAVAELAQARGNVTWIRDMLPTEEVRVILCAATVFVCPSVYEPLGIVNLEAMACETAVVASAVGGIPEVVVDGVTGTLVPFTPESVTGFEHAFADAVNAMAADPSRAKAMGKAGRERAVADFGWRIVCCQLLTSNQGFLWSLSRDSPSIFLPLSGLPNLM